MTQQAPAAQDCTSMSEVRQAIDALDRRIIALLGERFRYIEAAARIKQSVDSIRDDARIEQVIAQARDVAAAEGVPVEAIEQLYRQLIEAAISFETEKFRQKDAV
jgi:isochorismate pyruvate lyase